MASQPQLTECCKVCGRDQPKDGFPRIQHEGSRVQHQSWCDVCLAQYIDFQIERKPWNAIGCSECLLTLSEHQIRSLASQRPYQKWLAKSFAAFCDSSPDVFVCPSASCSWVCILSDCQVFECESCAYRFCLVCKVTMHEGETCDAYQVRRGESQLGVDDALSLATVRHQSSPCPNCATRLIKRSGCNHMTCSVCRHEFCWLCFGSYRTKEDALRSTWDTHRLTCPQHPSQAGSRIPLGRDGDEIAGYEDDDEPDDDNLNVEYLGGL